MGRAARGWVFNVQRFSVHDGPGIRTTVFFKGCPLRCVWCQNPESHSKRPQLMVYADRCRDDGHCQAACPAGALAGGGPISTRLKRQDCDACGQCVPACPFGALQVVGRQVTAAELTQEVLRDRAFYDASGGGVTVSGGEPTLQRPFLARFVRGCADAGLSVGLQTCGAFSWRAFAPLLPALAFVHYDLKLIDPKAHRRLTGADNRRILANARRLARSGLDVTFRMPLVPDCTDSLQNLHDVAAFLHDIDVGGIELLAYHRMGVVKTARLGAAPPPPHLDTALEPAGERLGRAAALLAEQGIEVRHAHAQ